MDDTIVSILDSRYYGKAIAGACFFLLFTGCLIYGSLFYTWADPGRAYLTLATMIGLDCLYYYIFSKTWKKVTVTANEVIVYDFVFRKQITIPFDMIKRVGTYQSARARGGWRGFSQDLVIEFGDGDSVKFSETWYSNYDRLKMAIYLHKYGPGHGRERYLERHGRG